MLFVVRCPMPHYRKSCPLLFPSIYAIRVAGLLFTRFALLRFFSRAPLRCAPDCGREEGICPAFLTRLSTPANQQRVSTPSPEKRGCWGPRGRAGPPQSQRPWDSLRLLRTCFSAAGVAHAEEPLRASSMMAQNRSSVMAGAGMGGNHCNGQERIRLVATITQFRLVQAASPCP
jgi:hypothetical protein